MNKARLFYVVDSIEDSPEIFETLEEAEEYYRELDQGTGRRIRICEVQNYYKEATGWNYEDRESTFFELANVTELMEV